MQLCVTVIQLALTTFCVAGIQTSDDHENWDTDVVNTINITAVGYYEKRIAGIAAKWVRATYTTDAQSSAIVAVGLDVADL